MDALRPWLISADKATSGGWFIFRCDSIACCSQMGSPPNECLYCICAAGFVLLQGRARRDGSYRVARNDLQSRWRRHELKIIATSRNAGEDLEYDFAFEVVILAELIMAACQVLQHQL